jgi:hypothetical protein
MIDKITLTSRPTHSGKSKIFITEHVNRNFDLNFAGWGTELDNCIFLIFHLSAVCRELNTELQPFVFLLVV